MNVYLNKRDLKCVVLCAGRGERIGVAFRQTPKVMIPLAKEPILRYVIDYWKDFAHEFIFVVGQEKEAVIKFIKGSGVKAKYIEQKQPRGIADAVYCAKNLVRGKFIAVLGDCICRGTFRFPKQIAQGAGVYRTNQPEKIKQSYSVEISQGLISRVREKPKILPNNLCGMGFYFFDPRVFKYIKQAKPSALRNEIEITDVIQDMIDRQEPISPVFFKGNYCNINYSEDIRKAEKIF